MEIPETPTNIDPEVTRSLVSAVRYATRVASGGDMVSDQFLESVKRSGVTYEQALAEALATYSHSH